MGREKGSVATAPGRSYKDRYRKAGRHAFDHNRPLVAKPALPLIKSKHKTIFEFVDNEKKKKLEFQVTTSKVPPPGYDFVPMGNPELTRLCKELSREQEAMIFIVSPSENIGGNFELALHLHRSGHHVRQAIVEQAQGMMGDFGPINMSVVDDRPEPIPQRQADINAQADLAIRDLFPRIPNTDRQMIIDRAFRKNSTFHGEPTVGLAPDIPLSRRAQLAVLAHIRHTHTTYDQLLRQTSRNNARRIVEPLCLDILVKWRGDEENGRDDLDIILKEVVVISDDEDEDQDQSSDQDQTAQDADPDQSSEELSASRDALPPIPGLDSLAPIRHQEPRKDPVTTPRLQAEKGPAAKVANNGVSKRKKKKGAVQKTQKGFGRYQAAWDQAVHRFRQEESGAAQHPGAPSIDRVPVNAAQPPAQPSPRGMPSAFGTRQGAEVRELPTRLEERSPRMFREAREWPPNRNPDSTIDAPGMPATVVPGPHAFRKPPLQQAHPAAFPSQPRFVYPVHMTTQAGVYPLPPGSHLSSGSHLPKDQPLPSIEAPSPDLVSRGIPRQQSGHDRSRFSHGADSPSSPVFTYPPRPQHATHVPVYPAREPIVVTTSPRMYGHREPDNWVRSDDGYYDHDPRRVVVTDTRPQTPPRYPPPPMYPPSNGSSDGYREWQPPTHAVVEYGYGEWGLSGAGVYSTRALAENLLHKPPPPSSMGARFDHRPHDVYRRDDDIVRHVAALPRHNDVVATGRDPNPFLPREPLREPPRPPQGLPAPGWDDGHSYRIMESRDQRYWPAATGPGDMPYGPPSTNSSGWSRGGPHVPVPPAFADNPRGIAVKRRSHDRDLEKHGVIILD